MGQFIDIIDAAIFMLPVAMALGYVLKFAVRVSR